MGWSMTAKRPRTTPYQGHTSFFSGECLLVLRNVGLTGTHISTLKRFLYYHQKLLYLSLSVKRYYGAS